MKRKNNAKISTRWLVLLVTAAVLLLILSIITSTLVLYYHGLLEEHLNQSAADLERQETLKNENDSLRYGNHLLTTAGEKFRKQRATDSLKIERLQTDSSATADSIKVLIKQRDRYHMLSDRRQNVIRQVVDELIQLRKSNRQLRRRSYDPVSYHRSGVTTKADDLDAVPVIEATAPPAPPPPPKIPTGAILALGLFALLFCWALFHRLKDYRRERRSRKRRRKGPLTAERHPNRFAGEELKKPAA